MPETPLNEPNVFGPYVLVSLVGEGGMARVFRAFRGGPMGFRKEVAIKRIRVDVTRDNQSVVRSLVNEARLGGQLKHANIVDTYEFGTVGDEHYIVLEYVHGLTLRSLLDGLKNRHCTMPLSAALDLALQLCDGLDYAHTHRSAEGRALDVVHRDLKPANIMVSWSGTAKIMDFGIAKSSEAMFHTTTDGTAKGTFGFMSPEQLSEPAAIDARSDEFALGSILFEVLTGEPLITGSNPQNVMYRIISGAYLGRMSLLERSVPSFHPIIERCVQVRPDQRYPDIASLRKDMENVEMPFDRRYGCREMMRFIQQTSTADTSDGAVASYDAERLDRSASLDDWARFEGSFIHRPALAPDPLSYRRSEKPKGTLTMDRPQSSAAHSDDGTVAVSSDGIVGVDQPPLSRDTQPKFNTKVVLIATLETAAALAILVILGVLVGRLVETESASPIVVERTTDSSGRVFVSTTNGDRLYEATEDRTTWDQSEAVCQMRGGHLVSIDSADEQVFLDRFLTAAYGKEYCEEGWWIGLTDRDHEGSYSWSDPTLSAHWLNWARGEPNDEKSPLKRGEDCVIFDFRCRGGWNDADCTSAVSYVCERAAP